MADFKNYISHRGYKRLRDEHHYLRAVERPKIVDEVSYAASLGDRSENAEYIYGKKRLREIDRRLRWLHRRLAAAELVEVSQDRGDIVYFGATVTVAYADGTERTLELLGEDEIEIDLGRISWRSPIGAALMRKREGDTVVFASPERGKESVEILEVAYLPQQPDPLPSRWDLHLESMKARGQEIQVAMDLDSLGELLEEDEGDN